MDRDLLFRRLVVTDRRQPGRRTAAASCRVHDEVGVEGLLGAVGTEMQEPYPGDAVSSSGGDEPDDLAPVDDFDRGKRPDTRAYVAFQVRPAGLTDEGLPGAAPEAEQMTARGEAQLREVPDHRETPCDHVLDQAGKEFVEDLRPSGHQQMGVP